MSPVKKQGNNSVYIEKVPVLSLPKLPEKMTKPSSSSIALQDKREGKRPSKRLGAVALVYEGLCTFEYGIAAEVFGLERPEAGGRLYDFSSVALENPPLRAAGGLLVEATGTQQDLDDADIVIVPGWRGKDEVVPEALCTRLRQVHQRGARLVSICSGIYVLGAAGLLAGRRVTTHWRYAAHFRARYPEANLQENELYVDEGDIITSAGSSAGIDACLHLVRCDYGAKTANSVARRLVMHGHRHGGQAQFIEQPLPDPNGGHRLSAMMDEVRQRLEDNHRIASMAMLAGMSSRTFQRRFRAFTGTTAMQWLMRERVVRCCLLLETTDLPVESISRSVGFGAAETLRYHFRRILGVSPLEYRSRFHTKEE